MIALATAVGILIGSIPTAQAVSRRRDVDLSEGSGNPGTANALRLGGPRIAAVILILDLTKGVAAALAGWAIAGPGGGVAAGLAAVAGQVANPWRRFRGGKGLGVAAGATSVLFPHGLAIALVVMVIGARLMGAARGALAGITASMISAFVWTALDWPAAWGIPTTSWLAGLGIGIAAITMPKLLRDAMDRPAPA